MDKNYIAPQTALKKLRAARKLSHTVYLYAATGYGKTELIRQYLSNRHYLYLSCEDADWDASVFPVPAKKPEEGGPRSVVVIDDIHRLKSEERQRDVLSLLHRTDVWLLFISRSRVPAWLLPAYMQTGFLVIPEEDFRLNEAEAAGLLARFGVQVSEQELSWLVEHSKGNAYTLGLAARLMESGTGVGPELAKGVSRLLSDYLENAVFVVLEPELLEFLMQLSVVEEFDLSLAEMLTGSPRRHVY